MILIDSPITPFSTAEEVAAWQKQLLQLRRTAKPRDRAQIMAALRSLPVVKFNPNHAPAGSPKGGQFTSHVGHTAPAVEMLGLNLFGSATAIKDYTNAMGAALGKKLVANYDARELPGKGKYLFVHMTSGGQKGIKIQRSFVLPHDGSTPYVLHDFFEVPAGAQGTGLGRALTEASLKEYRKMGLSHIETVANLNVGGYAWARMGFVPTPLAWSQLIRDVRKKLEMQYPTKGSTVVPGSTDFYQRRINEAHQIHAVVKKLLHDHADDPTGIRKLAALHLGDRKIGKELLLDTKWRGTFALNDQATTRMVGRYLKKK